MFPSKTVHRQQEDWVIYNEMHGKNSSQQFTDNKRIDSHTTRSTGQPPTVPLHPVIPCFLGTEHQEGVSCPLVVSKRYHICDTKCTCEENEGFQREHPFDAGFPIGARASLLAHDFP